MKKTGWFLTFALAVLMFSGVARADLVPSFENIGETVTVPPGGWETLVEVGILNTGTQPEKLNIESAFFSGFGDAFASFVDDLYANNGTDIAPGEVFSFSLVKFFGGAKSPTGEFVPKETGQFGIIGIGLDFNGQSFSRFSEDDNPLWRGEIANVAAPVPEPATMWLFGTGAAGFIGNAWRRRRGGMREEV